jgi:cyclopropane-fatty-acyl-phospholipid synthase
LLDESGLNVLDIGSGWGGLSLELSHLSQAKVTSVTLSEEQAKISTERAAKSGMAGDMTFRLQDYRTVDDTFDRIVSVVMFEHVAVSRYPEFFAKCRDLLADDGVGLLHTIGQSSGPAGTGDWLRKYIFPGGYMPALSEVIPAIEQAGLFITDIEFLRFRYADTLRDWRRRY